MRYSLMLILLGISSLLFAQKEAPDIRHGNRDYNKDNFAWILNDILKRFFRMKRGKIKNSEILGYIKEYNPYYQEEKFKNKRQPIIT